MGKISYWIVWELDRVPLVPEYHSISDMPQFPFYSMIPDNSHRVMKSISSTMRWLTGKIKVCLMHHEVMPLICVSRCWLLERDVVFWIWITVNFLLHLERFIIEISSNKIYCYQVMYESGVRAQHLV